MSNQMIEATGQSASLPDSPSAIPPPLPELSDRTITITHTDRSGLVISKIQDISFSMLETAIRGDPLSMPYRSRNSPHRAEGSLRFPGSSVQEAEKFNRMLLIMELVHHALLSGRLITKRALFKKQGNVDQLVDDLAFTLGVGRDALNVVAASKGLIAGPLKLVLKDHSTVSCFADLDENHAIPSVAIVHKINFGETRWVLVVEKEATFRTLAASQYWKHCVHGQGIIITGKGYTDLATLQFLNLIHSVCPNLPMWCVVDCDPHGVDIMRKYKYGSRGFGHEENAKVPGLQWLGVKMDDVLEHVTKPSKEDSSQSSTDQSSQSSAGYLVSQNSESYTKTPSQSTARSGPRRSSVENAIEPLTENDREKIQSMFRAMTDGDRELDQEEAEQLRELQVMLMLNMKAEIQAVDQSGDLSGWLDEKMEIA